MKTKARRKSSNVEDRRRENAIMRTFRKMRNNFEGNLRNIMGDDTQAPRGFRTMARDVDRAALAEKIRIDAEREKKKSAMSKKVKR